jgi:hypothetical protein
MLKWLLRGKLRKVVDSDILDARSMLSTMKLKLYKEGAEGTLAYGEGVGEVAGLLSQRFSISVADALTGRGLTWEQLDDASRDLTAAMTKARPMLDSEVHAVRSFGHKQTAGCMILYHLYRMRFLSQHAPEDQQALAAAMADRVADFARVMAEIGDGIREPSDAYD